MVSIYEMGRLQEKFNKNLEKYLKNHYGEFVVLVGDEEIFCNDEYELQHELAKYRNIFGPTVYHARIAPQPSMQEIAKEVFDKMRRAHEDQKRSFRV